MAAPVDAATLKAWLSEEAEIALLDVREQGEFGWSHLFFAVPLPYSRFELALPALVPNAGVRLVLCDADGSVTGVAAKAARRAEALGYRNVHILAGGTKGWQRAGYTLYAGVNVPSKTFGELIEHARHTPRITAETLEGMRRAGESFVIVDGRPFAEYSKMNIPGGICCPNGELVLRIRDLVPDSRTKIIVNCAGRTRSIIGAQTLIDFGIDNEVYALENGTQGWTLAGLELERGADRRHPVTLDRARAATLSARARELAQARGAKFVAAAQAQSWLADRSRTTYLLDVRSPEEFAASPVPGFAHAPGGQLIQATDQWVGIKGARLVLLDEEEVRAPVVAAWLRQLGHEAHVLAGGTAAAHQMAWPAMTNPSPQALPDAITAREVAVGLHAGSVQLIDVRPGMTYRKGHIGQAQWSIRPRVAAIADGAKLVVLVADEPGVAALAALDLREAGCRDVRLLAGDEAGWREAGLNVVATPAKPSDADCIDFLFFTHGRHEGNADAARQYLAWEIGLVGQLDAQERGTFRL
jgi:rhodanese-related sulfurtransferase